MWMPCLTPSPSRRLEDLACRVDRVALLVVLAAGGLGRTVHDEPDAFHDVGVKAARQVGHHVLDARHPPRRARHASRQDTDRNAGVSQLTGTVRPSRPVPPVSRTSGRAG